MDVTPGYKRTDVGVIPVDWETSTILGLSRQIIDFRGRTPKKLGMEWGGGEIPALSAGNVKMGYIDFSEECYFGSDALYKRWMIRGAVAKDDIVFTTEAPLGNVALIPDGRKYILSQRTVLIQVDPDKASSRFVFQQMLSNRFQRLLADHSSGSTAKGIQRKRFEQLRLALPPEPEQCAIAEALSDVDGLVGGLDRLIAKKHDIRQAAMQQLLTGQTRLPGFHGAWPIVSFESLCRSFTKQTGFDYTASIKPSLTFEDKGTSLPFIQNKNFSGKITNYETDYFVPESIAKNFPEILLDERCLLISISGRVGNVGIFSNDRRAFVGGAIAVSKFKDPKQVDWVMYYFQSYEGQSKLLGNVKAGSHQNLILDDLRKIKIPLPSLKEQEAITATLSDMDLELAALEQRREKSRDLKQAMMQELLTGKTRLV